MPKVAHRSSYKFIRITCRTWQSLHFFRNAESRTPIVVQVHTHCPRDSVKARRTRAPSLRQSHNPRGGWYRDSGNPVKKKPIRDRWPSSSQLFFVLSSSRLLPPFTRAPRAGLGVARRRRGLLALATQTKPPLAGAQVHTHHLRSRSSNCVEAIITRMIYRVGLGYAQPARRGRLRRRFAERSKISQEPDGSVTPDYRFPLEGTSFQWAPRWGAGPILPLPLCRPAPELRPQLTRRGQVTDPVLLRAVTPTALSPNPSTTPSDVGWQPLPPRVRSQCRGHGVLPPWGLPDPAVLFSAQSAFETP
ncbi:unnamed protein product [Trichogramma brassicae]|uniref:Uncharacterized protein n=1 Tax=Trichogramma brassicae TaxID=86971 RepID=A0A6H5I9T4_9HYME|nr:unnamed protein product [Trichogramma brassicae]